MQSSRKLTRIAEKVFNKPLLITEAGLEPIVSYLKSPNRTFNQVSYEQTEVEKVLQEFDYSKNIESYEEKELLKIKQRAGINPDTNVGLIEVTGTLVAKAGQVNGCVELTSYEKLKKITALQIKLGAKSIVYSVDSGGGEAYTAFSTGRDLRKMADDAGIKTYAYVDGCACSGAYMMASATHEIISNEDSDIGSIGVLVQLINPSKHLEKEGLERTFITAGDNKVPFDQDGSFKPEFIERIQKGVDSTYMKFVDAVDALRPSIGRDNIVATQASVYDATEALEIGLIDKIMEWDEFVQYVNTDITQPSGTSSTFTIKTEENMTEQVNEMEGLKTEIQDLQTSLDAKTEELTTLLSEKVGFLKQISDLTEVNEKLSAEVTKVAQEKVESERRQKLEEVLGKDNEQVASVLASSKLLDDTSFTTIVSAFGIGISQKAEQLEEVGDEGEQAEVQVDLAKQIASRIKTQ